MGRVQGRPACNVPCSFHPGEKGQRETLTGVTSCSGSTSLDHFLQCWCPDALLGSQSDCELGATEPHSSHEVTLASCRLQLSTHCDWGGLKEHSNRFCPTSKQQDMSAENGNGVHSKALGHFFSQHTGLSPERISTMYTLIACW